MDMESKKKALCANQLNHFKAYREGQNLKTEPMLYISHASIMFFFSLCLCSYMLCLLTISISSFMYLFGALMLTTSTYVSSQVMRIIKSSSLAPLRFLKQMSCIHMYLLNRGEYSSNRPGSTTKSPTEPGLIYISVGIGYC